MEKEQFGQLRFYAYKVYKQNPGSTVKIKSQKNSKGQYVLKNLYICSGALKTGFLEECRRIISLNACFLKGPWPGLILDAVGRDVNSQIYPIARGVFRSEKKGVLAAKSRLEQGDTKGKKVRRVSKLGQKMHCSKCGGEGHNMKICTVRVNQLKVNNSLSFAFLLNTTRV